MLLLRFNFVFLSMKELMIRYRYTVALFYNTAYLLHDGAIWQKISATGDWLAIYSLFDKNYTGSSLVIHPLFLWVLDNERIFSVSACFLSFLCFLWWGQNVNRKNLWVHWHFILCLLIIAFRKAVGFETLHDSQNDDTDSVIQEAANEQIVKPMYNVVNNNVFQELFYSLIVGNGSQLLLIACIFGASEAVEYFGGIKLTRSTTTDIVFSTLFICCVVFRGYTSARAYNR